MRAMAVLILSAIATVGATAAARSRGDDDAANLAAELAGLRPGKPMACMPDYRSSPRFAAYGPDLVYTVSRTLKYVTRTNGGCEGVAHGDVLVTRQLRAQRCSGDIATTVDPVSRFPTGSCTYGDFTEYRK